MRKVKLSVEEKLTYRREIIVEIPDEMDESDLEEALDNAVREENLSDFVYSLKRQGISNNEGYDDDLNSPDDSEIECDMYDFIE